MEILPQERGEGQWVTSKEAAAIWGVTTGNLVKVARIHAEHLLGNVRGFGRGRVFGITKEGLLILRNIVDGNRWSASDAPKALIARKGLNNTAIATELLEAVKQLAIEVEALKSKQTSREQTLSLSTELLPAPTKEVPEMNLRSALNKFIREAAQKQNRNYNVVFSELYSQFYYRYKINIMARARTKAMSVIEYAEEYGHLEDLYALARKIYQ